jgi:hypothetical protein
MAFLNFSFNEVAVTAASSEVLYQYLVKSISSVADSLASLQYPTRLISVMTVMVGVVVDVMESEVAELPEKYCS